MIDAADSPLSWALTGWDPPVVQTARRVDPWAGEAFADLVDAERPGPEPGEPLPAMWHWLVLLDHPAQAELGEDGHRSEGPLMPPIPDRRRVFGGGRLRQDRPIPVGAELTCRSHVADVTVKSGRSGEMALVTVRHELSVEGRAVGVEEQDILYRSASEGAPQRTVTRPERGQPAPSGAWQLARATDPVLLSRFSALTYNGHRIHYDRPYATEVEGYPDLVVHGPLLALLALELPRRYRPEAEVVAFDYRLVRPAFVPDRIVAVGDPTPDGASIRVGAEGAAPSLTATATFR